MSSEAITIQVLGRDFEIACTPDTQAQLQYAADLLNQHCSPFEEHALSMEGKMLLGALSLAMELQGDAPDVSSWAKKLNEQIRKDTDANKPADLF